MLPLTFSNIIAMSVIFYLCLVAPGASRNIGQGSVGLSRYRTAASQTIPRKLVGAPKPAHDNPHNTSSTSAPRAAAIRRNKNKNRSTPRATPLRRNATKVRPGAGKRLAQLRAATPTKRRRQNEQPTPEPTGDASASTTVYVSGPNVFALLLPQNPGGGYPIYSVSARCDPFLLSQRWCPTQRKTVLHTVRNLRMEVGAGTLSRTGSSQGLRTRQRRMDHTCKWVWPFELPPREWACLEY